MGFCSNIYQGIKKIYNPIVENFRSLQRRREERREVFGEGLELVGRAAQYLTPQQTEILLRHLVALKVGADIVDLTNHTIERVFKPTPTRR
jgi:hypothetical protein